VVKQGPQRSQGEVENVAVTKPPPGTHKVVPMWSPKVSEAHGPRVLWPEASARNVPGRRLHLWGPLMLCAEPPPA
jgi:hypothetical protein